MTRLATASLVWAIVVTASASAGRSMAQEAPPEGKVPQESVPAAAAPPPEDDLAPDDQGPAANRSVAPDAPVSRKAPEPEWTGPRVELAYRIYSLSDSLGGGAVGSACFSGFLPTRFVRAGGGIEAGGRAYAYGPTEGLMTANVFAGYQHLHDLGRVLPYVVAVGELGVLFGKRLHTPVSRAIRGAGVELGADVNLVRTLYVGLGLSFMVYTMDGLAYDTFGLRLSLGL